MRESEKLIEVYKAASDMEAQVIRGLLESYGISCLLKSKVAPSVHMFAIGGMGEVRVMVRDSMVEKARELIRG